MMRRIWQGIIFIVIPHRQHYPSVANLGNVTECDLSDLSLYENIPYEMALTAYDIYGNESDFSDPLYLTLDDGIDDFEDNCPDIYNPNQEDNYPPGGNDIGDACESITITPLLPILQHPLLNVIQTVIVMIRCSVTGVRYVLEEGVNLPMTLVAKEKNAMKKMISVSSPVPFSSCPKYPRWYQDNP